MADRIVTDPDTTSPDSLPTKPTVSRGARACTVCRTAKMKCVGAEDEGAKPCQRCRRSNLECVFEKHRRGRKPGSKLSEASKMLRKLEKGINSAKVKRSDTGELSPQLPYPVSDSRSAPLQDHTYHSPYSPRGLYVPSQATMRASNGSPYPPSATRAQFPTLTSPFPPRYADTIPATSQRATSTSSLPRSIEDDDDDDDKDPEEIIYPAKMVERENRRHSFFGTVLDNSSHSNPPPQKTQSPSQPVRQTQRPESITIPRLPAPIFDDPVGAGILSDADVTCLFEMVFVRLNPFINLFDPALHTPAYVRSRCPFLFTTLLTTGCKFWRPERYKACQRLAEDFCLRAFQEGWKRVEVVQAFACMTYWKDPDDTRTWMYIGYACRMAVELGLNRYHPTLPTGETQLQRMERRNRERTYLVLWVHDRSLSMQTGRQWMLPEDDLVRTSASWHESSSLRPVDVVISAQVQLRRIAAEVTDVFYLHKSISGTLQAHADVNYDILLRACNGKLNMWGTTWNAALRQAGGDSFHVSLLAFFRLHVRLFLNSFGLQSSHVLERSPSVSALAVCYTAAVDTLRLVTKDFATVDMLRYGQDSVTVMTAYSAIFLLKLLRSGVDLGEGAPASIHGFVLAAADAYQDAAKGMPPSSAVEYHGRFLRALVVKDRARIERKSSRDFELPAHCSDRQGITQNGHAAEDEGDSLDQPHGIHEWHFPASPHFPSHPLVPPEQSYDATATANGGYVPKMELAYWYSIHSDLGYGDGIMPGGDIDTSSIQPQQQQQQQPPYQMYGSGATSTG